MADRFLTDLRCGLDPDGELPVTATGDIALSQGRANVHRAILRRTVVSPGSLVHRPNFGAGLRDLLEMPATPTDRARMAAKIKQQVQQDPRVLEASATVALGTPEDPDRPNTVTASKSVSLRGDDEAQTISISLSE